MYAVYSPEDPNFRPFCSRTHHFWDMTQLPIWRNQLPVWLFRPYSVYVSFIYSTGGPKFHPFCSTMYRLHDTTQLPVWLIQLSVWLLWPYLAYVCCNYSLQAQIWFFQLYLGYLCSVAQGVQIFICFQDKCIDRFYHFPIDSLVFDQWRDISITVAFTQNMYSPKI